MANGTAARAKLYGNANGGIKVQTQVDFARSPVNGSARGESGSRRAGTRAIYLNTRPDATFAMVDVPATPVQGTTGVVICPLFGWDDLCTHRSRRTWARALADAGHATIRIDLPGTGDSVGSPLTPNQLTGWISAVSAAASWLRDEQGCARVCALGIGFGGMLAWLATAEGAPIDDLALWAVPTRGQRLLREIHAASKLSIDSQVRLLSAPDGALVEAAGPADGGLLDEAGQLTTKATADSLRSIDLLEIALPHAQRRRVLLFKRSGATADEVLARHLQDSGLELTVESGDSYGGLMRYVQQSVVPHDAIAGSINWLAAGPAVPGPSRPTVPSRVPTTQTVTFEHDGVLIRETAITIDLPSGTVWGIRTEPVGVASLNLCAAFFSGGSDRRIGPNRIWVDQARRWATRGLTSVRVDPGGVGDSDGDEREWDHVQAHYRASHIDHTVELLDVLTAQGGPNRFVLVGFCSGGYRSLHVALTDRRVAGVFAIGMPFFRWTWWTSRVRDSWLPGWEPAPGDSRLKITVARILKQCLKVVHAGQHRFLRAADVYPNLADRLVRQIAGQGTELLFLLKRSSYAYEQMTLPRRHARLNRLGRVWVRGLPGADQRFRPLPSQQFVITQLDAALDRVIRSEAPPVPARIVVGGDAPRHRNGRREPELSRSRS